ncbi:zinc finger protein 664 isoform X2 [Callithrix jacchus]
MWIQAASSPQHPRQSRARPRALLVHLQCGSLALRSHPGAARSAPGPASPPPLTLVWARAAARPHPGRKRGPGRPLPKRGRRTPRGRTRGLPRLRGPLPHYSASPKLPSPGTSPAPRRASVAPEPRGWGGRTPSPVYRGGRVFKVLATNSRPLPALPAPPGERGRTRHTPGSASPAGAAVALLQAAVPLGWVFPAGGGGSWLPMGGARRAGLAGLGRCPGRAADGGQWAPPAPRISHGPTRALAAVHPGSGAGGEAWPR